MLIEIVKIPIQTIDKTLSNKQFEQRGVKKRKGHLHCGSEKTVEIFQIQKRNEGLQILKLSGHSEIK